MVGAQGESILNSKHNLSASGPGTVRATSEDRVCIFCHTPHGARDVAPLWNRPDSNAGYIPYDSPTLQSQPGQPTGTSKLCLSCHDGTIALGDLVSQDTDISMMGGGSMPAGHSLIGTDLRDDHPISFPYTDALGGPNDQHLSPPGAWDERISLDNQGMLQCTTCHDPHDDRWGQFLVMDNTFAALCRECHVYSSFDQTSHATSGASLAAAQGDPWPHADHPDVASNSCLNCHTSHHAGQGPGLLLNSREEEVCFACHDGGVAASDVRRVMQKTYRHPVELFTGVHQAGEEPEDAEGHVECADCHNPHMAHDEDAEAPLVPGTLQGVSGISADGAPLDVATNEFEVCFKCHANDNQPPINAIERQINTANTAREFSPFSPSFHPVQAPGKSSSVPSLLPGYSTASLIYCSDCHGNDDSDAPGTVKGPHGSNHEFLLKYEYRTGDNISESAQAYSLCYQCHSRQSILADESFSEHRKHIVEERTPCSVCHDAHGIDRDEGNEVNNAHLINFDLRVVEVDPSSGRLEYRSSGPEAGQCALRCHGEDHSPETYP